MRAIAGLVAVGWWLGGASALAQPSASGPPQPAALDVPYLPQTVLLCGGAALAMVERWWGRRGVYAEDFADLVRPALGGIRTVDLVAAARARGWDARVLRGGPKRIREHLRDGVPVVALLRIGRDRFHYVVVLGWSAGRVVFHDPADAPSLSLDEAEFLARWTGANRWALALRPAVGPADTTDADPTDPSADPPSAAAMPCAPWLDRALDAAATGALEAASRLLAHASRACPGEPLVTRELAAVRFKQGRPAEASSLAARYVAIAPADELGWQLLATNRYLAGDQEGALDAWNRIGRPTVDLVRIDGSRRIRFGEILRATSLPHGTLLTSSRLALARRRVSGLPAVRRAAVESRPLPGGLVEVHVSVLERRLLPAPWRLLAGGAIQAAAQREAGLEVSSPTGAGGLWTVTWRWESARPRRAFRADLPARVGFPGVITVERSWERFRFAAGPERATTVEEARRSVGIGFGGWATAGVRPWAALRIDGWSDNRQYVVAAAGMSIRAAADRFVLGASSEGAVARSHHRWYTRGSAHALWMSAHGLDHATWSTRLGVEWASERAPRGTWPVAGGARSWAIPLRAGSATAAGLVAGRRIVHGGLTADRPVVRAGPLVIVAGLFLDGAGVAHAGEGAPAGAAYLDGGVGIRIAVAGGQRGVLRVDMGRGLLGDRRSALTVGVHERWPPFQPDFR